MAEKAEILLQNHSLKKTSTRIDVLNVFLSFQYALSHSDIENQLKESTDRVTLYRTLNTFEDTGITHKVMGEDGVARFALCDHCDAHHHHDEHIHFHCNNCGKTYCLDDEFTPSFNVPEGYQMNEFTISVKGVCKNCN